MNRFIYLIYMTIEDYMNLVLHSLALLLQRPILALILEPLLLLLRQVVRLGLDL